MPWSSSQIIFCTPQGNNCTKLYCCRQMKCTHTQSDITLGFKWSMFIAATTRRDALPWLMSSSGIYWPLSLSVWVTDVGKTSTMLPQSLTLLVAFQKADRRLDPWPSREAKGAPWNIVHHTVSLLSAVWKEAKHLQLAALLYIAHCILEEYRTPCRRTCLNQPSYSS